MTLLRAKDNYQARDKWAYVLLAEEIRPVGAEPARNAAALLLRMCFNSLFARQAERQLSPAYYQAPAVPVSMKHRDLDMEYVDAGGFANATKLLSRSARLRLAREDAATAIAITSIKDRGRGTCYATARGAGVSKKCYEPLSRAFFYQKFSQKTD